MKKSLRFLLIILVLLLCGCSNKKNEEIKNIVISYNQAIFANDIVTAEKYLARYALDNFKVNVNKYKSTSKIISQEIEILSSSDEFAVVNVSIDSILVPEGKNIQVLSRDKVIYYLEKSDSWKIIKTGVINNLFKKSLNKKVTNADKTNVDKIAKDYIELVSQGKILESANYLTAGLYANAIRYDIKNIPIGKVENQEVDVIASSEEEMVVKSRYLFSGQQRELIFVLLKINGEWKIQDVI